MKRAWRWDFYRGPLLQDETGYLEKGNYKEVFSKMFVGIEQVDENLLGIFLFEAWDLDEELTKR